MQRRTEKLIYWFYFKTFRWWCHQDSGVRDLCLYLPTETNNYRAIHKQKYLWERSGVHLRNFRNTVEQQQPQKTKTNKKNPENYSTFRKGRTASFSASSYPPGQHCWVPRGNSPARTSSLPGKGEQGEWSASQPFKGLAFTPSRAQQAEMYRDGWEEGRAGDNQYQPCRGETTVPSVLICSPSNFCHWRKQKPALSPQIPCRFYQFFTPQVFSILWVPPHLSPASPPSEPRISTGNQPKSL